MRQRQPVETSRRKPSQARAIETTRLILDAAAQILEREGEHRMTTNHVAARSGFSIGTLYQYFANRDEILIALAKREEERVAPQMRALLARIEVGDGLNSARAFIAALVQLLKRRRGAKRSFALIATLRDSGALPALSDEFAATLEAAWNRLGDSRGPRVTKAHAYVLTHAILGVLRDAALGNPKLIDEPAFEEALFRIVTAFSRQAQALDQNRSKLDPGEWRPRR